MDVHTRVDRFVTTIIERAAPVRFTRATSMAERETIFRPAIVVTDTESCGGCWVKCGAKCAPKGLTRSVESFPHPSSRCMNKWAFGSWFWAQEKDSGMKKGSLSC